MSVERTSGVPHYRALSNVAANVAAVAALAAQQEEQARWHGRSRSSEPHATLNHGDDDDDVSEDALARLADSFHSEGGRSARRKQVVWGHDAHPSRGASVGRSRQSSQMPSVLQMTAPSLGDSVDSLVRGRPLVRGQNAAEDVEEWLGSSAARRGSRASRRGATMVFMGVWALFGIGTLSGGRTGLSTGLVQRTGKVLARAEVPPWPPVVSTEVVPEARSPDSLPLSQQHEEAAVVEFLGSTDGPYFEQQAAGPSMEYIIGRISAWICTTLYLTSRLPQIWKNVSSCST